MGGANHDLKPFVASAFVAMVEKGHHPAEVNQTISMLAKDFMLWSNFIVTGPKFLEQRLHLPKILDTYHQVQPVCWNQIL